MPSPCNSANIKPIKVSSLSNISGRTPNKIRPEDFFLLVQSGSNASPNSLFSRKATFSDVLTFLSTVSTGAYTGSFTGSFRGYMSASKAFNKKTAFHGTASWSNRAISSSYAFRATSSSYAFRATSSNYAFRATSSSYARSSSYALKAHTASYARSSSYAFRAISSSYARSSSYAFRAISSSYARSSSYALKAHTASYATVASSLVIPGGGGSTGTPYAFAHANWSWDSNNNFISSSMYNCTITRVGPINPFNHVVSITFNPPYPTTKNYTVLFYSTNDRTSWPAGGGVAENSYRINNNLSSIQNKTVSGFNIASIYVEFYLGGGPNLYFSEGTTSQRYNNVVVYV